MHALQLLHHIPQVLHARPEPVADLLLRHLVHVQEPLEDLAVEEPERALALTLGVPEGPVLVERDIARRPYPVRQPGLKSHE